MVYGNWTVPRGTIACMEPRTRLMPGLVALWSSGIALAFALALFGS